MSHQHRHLSAEQNAALLRLHLWHSWKNRYGKVKEHNRWIPREYWPGNGKIERSHRAIEVDCIQTETSLTVGGALCVVTRYVNRYNTVLLYRTRGKQNRQAVHQVLGRANPKSLQFSERSGWSPKAALMPRRLTSSSR
jgi:hypothetical protein